jgi:hypothetical protein
MAGFLVFFASDVFSRFYLILLPVLGTITPFDVPWVVTVWPKSMITMPW